MFMRREKKEAYKKVLSFIWPENGWKRYNKYVLLRLKRLKGTTNSISKGVACGVAVSFTPFIGAHFVLAAIFSWLVRGNILASAIGTAMGNPWTFPFIWVSTLFIGRSLLGCNVNEPVEFVKIFQKTMNILVTFNFSVFVEDVWPIIFPMIIGSVPLVVVSWLLTYYILKNALKKVGVKKIH